MPLLVHAFVTSIHYWVLRELIYLGTKTEARTHDMVGVQ